MAKAVVVTAFTGRPDNEDRARRIEVGEEIEGELAQVALRERWAKSNAPAGKADPAKGEVSSGKGKGKGEAPKTQEQPVEDDAAGGPDAGGEAT